MSHVFHRNPHQNYPFASRGEGPYLFDKQGRKYIDASGGAAVSCLGHNHPRVLEAIESQVRTLPFAHSGFFTTDAMEDLADFLIKSAPGKLDKAYFLSGGSEAIEAALKLGRQYFLEKGQPQRTKYIARRQSYHGNSLGALAAGGNAWRRKQYEPLLIEMHHIAPCYAYRDQQLNESGFEYGQRVANELEQKILELGDDSVIGFIAEPIVGATLGCVTANDGYFKRVREICDQYGVLLILDEVMCGMGRSGYLYAHEHDQIDADIVTIAKGLGAGYQPIGAMLCSSDIYDAIYSGSGFFQHGHTYMGHATACAASLAVQKAIVDENLLHNVRQQGDYLFSQLQNNLSSHPNIGDIRGRGLFIGVEIVADKFTKAPLDAGLKTHAKIKKVAMDKGLMCYPMGGCIDGQNGDHFLLAPPFICDSQHIDEIASKVTMTIDEVLPR